MVDIEDPALPAVAYLVGPGAQDILGVAVSAAGGTLRHARVSQVQYRPGHELVVHYRCDIDWQEGRDERDLLLAATTHGGALPGTLPVVGETDEGTLEVSVWRYPFDPIIEGLPIAVTAEKVASVVAPELSGPVTVEVVAYRATERAVVRVRDGDGATVYVKAVRPQAVPALLERHAQLLAAELPVASILRADLDAGLVVLAELPGTTLRERIKRDLPGWPAPKELLALTSRLRRVPATGLPAVSGRVRDALSHARMLETVVPELRARLQRLEAAFEAALPAVDARSGVVIHGDLHEGQLVIDEDGRISGLLDIDDLGVGDPLDDLATLVAHTRFRALVAGAAGGRIRAYSERLRSAFAKTVDASHLDIAVSAVLVGLATGVFRIQRSGWPATIALVIDDAESLTGPSGA